MKTIKILINDLLGYLAPSVLLLLLWVFLPMVDFLKLPNGPLSSWEIISLVLGGCTFLFLGAKAIRKKFTIGKVELFFMAFIIYTALLNLHLKNETEWVVASLFACCFFGLYLLVKNSPHITPSVIYNVLLLAFVFQMGVGLLQWSGFLTVDDVYFRIRGGFSNPGPWGIFMALGSILTFWRTVSSKIKLTYFPLFLLFTFTVALSGSRTAILATIAGLLCLSIAKWKAIFLSKKMYTVVALIFMGVLTIWALYLYRPASADGRMFIWQRSTEIFLENPVFGIGTGKFQPAYMEKQAEYFSRNQHDTKAAWLADTVKHPFNETFLLLIETGIVGCSLLLLAFYFLIAKPKSFAKKHDIEIALLAAIGIASLFSYPLQEAPLTMVLACSLGVLGKAVKCESRLVPSQKLVVPIALLFSGFTIWYGTVRFKGYRFWKKAKAESFFGNRQLADDYFISADQYLGKNGAFLYNHGSTLQLSNRPKKALPVLEKSLAVYNDYQTYLFIGDIYWKDGYLEKAISAYEHAHNMVPNRFEPLYGLLQVYENSRNQKLAKRTARNIVNKKIKVDSKRTRFIIAEAQTFLTRIKEKLKENCYISWE